MQMRHKILALLLLVSGWVLAKGSKDEEVVFLQNGGKVQAYDLGTEAPQDFRAFQELFLPSLKDLQLKFPKSSLFEFQGPDKGKVIRYSDGKTYTWERMDGSVFSEWTALNQQQLVLSLGTKIDWFPSKSNLGQLIVIKWPNDSQIELRPKETINSIEIIYTKFTSEGIVSYLIPDTKRYGLPKFQQGPLVFYGSSRWDFFIQSAFEDFEKQDFYEYFESEFGIRFKSLVPIFGHKTSDEMYKKVGKIVSIDFTAAGFGGREAVELCCEDQQIQSTGDPRVDRFLKSGLHLGVFYHELTHNVAQNYCYSLNYKKEPILTEAVEEWFVEGFANLIANRFEPQKTVTTYRDTKEFFDKGLVPRDYKSMVTAKYRDRIPYILGTYLTMYLQKKYGSKAVVTYLTETCQGISGSKALAKATGKSADAFYSEAVKQFPHEFQASEPFFSEWTSSGTEFVPWFSRDLAEISLGKFPKEFRKLTGRSQYPDLFLALKTNLEFVKDKWEGYLAPGVGSGFDFYLWKNGYYRLSGPHYTVDYFPEHSAKVTWKKGGTLQFQSDGVIYQPFPDGSYALIAPGEEAAKQYKKDGRLIE